MIQTKRVYEKASKGDGFRVLVDRLWPRGLTKEKAGVNLWMKEIAPSDELRKWFHHEERNWGEFVKRYKAELAKKKNLLSKMNELEREHATVTLLYGSKDEKQNQAVMLAEMLKRKK
jgi:uncharacterized protein YeaO (DUF488 family)